MYLSAIEASWWYLFFTYPFKIFMCRSNRYIHCNDLYKLVSLSR